MRQGRLFLLLALMLVLAGCYQQADEGFEPITAPNDGQPTQSQPIVTVAPTDTPSDDTAATPLPFDDPTDAPTTQGQPQSLPTDAADDQEPTDDLPLIFTVAPTETLPVTLAPTLTATQNTGFITPGSPSLPVTVVPTETPAEDDAGDDDTDDGDTGSGNAPLITPTDFINFDDDCIYTVQPGDSLYRIAIRNETTVSALRTANPNVRGDVIFPGDRLNIPDCAAEGEEDDAPAATPTVTPNPTVEGGIIHIVQRGETLFVIAQRYGVTVQSIINANNLTNPNRIDPGQRLIIPE